MSLSTPEHETGDGNRRRGFLRTAFAALLGGLFCHRATAEEPAPSKDASLAMDGALLKTHVFKGRPPVEPLDTMIRFERSDNHTGRAMTHEVLSLIHEEKGTQSFPWTVYAHLSTHHVEGDACVVCSRLHKENAGWSSGLHSEVFNNGRGVGIGVNVEMSNTYTGPTAPMIIGMHIQAKGPQPCQFGIEMHDGGGHFEKAIGLNGQGRVGLDMAGQYDVGLHTHGNSIRVDEGTCIELDGAGRIRLRYKDGKIEFLNGDRCVGHLDVQGDDHAL
ncbi:MAG: hypothetical protein JXA69_12790 [Phycisphaerae bacterium]|nr:hypothetical protein [Phycisphaerae bacterium]